MRIGKWPLLFAFVVASCGSPAPTESPADRILKQACEYLWSAQSDDGAWHNQTHGLMRGGEATTAFVLNSLLDAREICDTPTAKLNASVKFLRSKVTASGALGLSDPDISDYPNYATAYAMSAMAKIGDETDRELIDRMTRYLVNQQFDEDRGIEPDHPAYGGWGFGETTLASGSVGHVDLSHTRRVLQSLRTAGHADSLTYARARRFLDLHQRRPNDERVRAAGSEAGTYDGGFFASSAVPVVNKSNAIGHDGGVYFFKSYATATADGLVALLSAEAEPDDPAVLDAQNWLVARSEFAYPAGIPVDSPAQWGRVMYYYHIMVRSEAYRALGGLAPSGWRDEVALLVDGRQRDDGSFSNPDGAPNKEDDPYIATAMIVEALAQRPLPE